MPLTRAGAASRSGKGSTADAVQTAFRDVTNSYLNANKENIPPEYFGGGHGSASLGGGSGNSGGGGGCSASSPNVWSRSSETLLRDTGFCGTPLQTGFARAGSESVSDAVECVTDKPSFGATLLTGPAGTLLPSGPAVEAAAAHGALTPMTPKGRALSGCTATAGNPSEDSGLLGVSRTPGHNAAHHPTHRNGSAACRSTQQRQCGLSTPHCSDTSAVEATPNEARQRPSHVARATLLSSPLYAPSNGEGAAANTRASGVQDDNGSGSQPPSQSSLLCTPNGACRSAVVVAAAATAAATGTRSRLDTPTRLDEIPLFFNNSFESGFESPTGDAAAGVGYNATQMTPYHTYDLQMAVEEVLRNCLDSYTPAKCSDASGATPHGSRRRAQQRQTAAAQAAPFNAYAALESLLPPSAMGAAGRDGLEVWAPAMLGSTPERLTAPQGAFAESDDEGVLTTPQSDRASCAMPSAGVRRDPMAYFSTAAVATANSSEGRCGVTRNDEDGVESIGNLSAGCGACGGAAESLSQNSSDARSGLEFNCRNDRFGGPDMLAMLAARLQQQQHPQYPHPHTETCPRSAHSTTGSMELNSRAFSERDVAAAAQQQSTALPPSYEVAACHQKPPHHGDHGYPDISSASSCVTATQAQPPTRRCHHLPHVKAAAGSLIAVGGRRVPVDKLHLLSIGDEPSLSAPSSMAGQAVTAASSRGGPKPRSQQLSSLALHHVEGPSMRRVPKANLVTVTHAAAAGLVEAVAPVPPGRHTSAPFHERGAALPPSSSYSTLSEVASARVAAAGPSARRVPSAMAVQQHPSSCSVVPGVVALSSAVDREGVQQSSEADVVAVLQFPKGQTMRFLTNLSTAALATAKDAVARDLASSKRTTGGTATSLLASRSLLRCVEVGKTYLAHVYAEGSPHEGVSYEDVGVCVQLITPSSSLYGALLGCVNGVLLRKVDILVNDEDRKQHERVLLQQTTAYIECERHFKFSGLPFQLESIYCTFDGSVCIIFYRLLAAADGSASSFASHRHPSTSRMVRELKFHLNCRVFLKRCLHRTHTHTQKK